MFVQCNKNNKHHNERHAAAKPLNRSLTFADNIDSPSDKTWQKRGPSHRGC
jgi:hypothetical protein